MQTKSSNYGSLQFQAWICTIFHGRNLYDFQRSKPFSKLHLLYLYPLSKQSFPNYSKTPDVVHFEFLEVEIIAFCYGSQILEILPRRDSYVIACAREERVWKIENKKYSKCQYETIFSKKNRRPATTWNDKKSAILKDKRCFQALIMEHAHYLHLSLFNFFFI